MAELDSPPVENLYEIGIRTYQQRIDKITADIAGETNPYLIVAAVEEVEQLKLGIKQNERRNKVFLQGETIVFDEAIV